MVQLYAYQYAFKSIWHLHYRQLRIAFWNWNDLKVLFYRWVHVFVFWGNILDSTTSVVVNIVTLETSSVLVLSFSVSKIYGFFFQVKCINHYKIICINSPCNDGLKKTLSTLPLGVNVLFIIINIINVFKEWCFF